MHAERRESSEDEEAVEIGTDLLRGDGRGRRSALQGRNGKA
jgi:hypothetical protein